MKKIIGFASCLMLFLSVNACAEQKKTLGNWDVHYMVLNTTFLTPEIAKANGIVRSKYNALVNISVLDKRTQKAQLAALSGEATNLLGSKRELSFKRVEEGDAIYYLAVIQFRDRENLRFNVKIQQRNTTQTLTFQQAMTVD
jgi:hypothetical protein